MAIICIDIHLRMTPLWMLYFITLAYIFEVKMNLYSVIHFHGQTFLVKHGFYKKLRKDSGYLPAELPRLVRRSPWSYPLFKYVIADKRSQPKQHEKRLIQAQRAGNAGLLQLRSTCCLRLRTWCMYASVTPEERPRIFLVWGRRQNYEVNNLLTVWLAA